MINKFSFAHSIMTVATSIHVCACTCSGAEKTNQEVGKTSEMTRNQRRMRKQLQYHAYVHGFIMERTDRNRALCSTEERRERALDRKGRTQSE